LSNNLARRHLPASQRAAFVIKIIGAGEVWASAGRPKKGAEAPFLKDAAKAAGISRETMKRAKKVFREAPDKFEQIAEGKKTAKQAVREINEEKGSQDPILDALGYPIPELALPYWGRADEVKAILKDISKLKSLANELYQRKDPMYSEVNLGYIHVELGNIYQTFKEAVPYAVCTECDGQQPDNCDLCRGRGVISEFRWSHALPPETREMRQQAIEKLRGASLAGAMDQTNEPSA